MPDHDDRERQQPEDIFRELRNRPAQRLDSGALWRRIQADLGPQPLSWWDRVAALAGIRGLSPAYLRLAGAGMAAVVIVGLVWLAPGIGTDGPPTGVATDAPANAADGDPGTGRLVPLASAGTDAAGADAPRVGDETEVPVSPTADPVRWILDVRLVRGFNRDLPADAIPSAGAGAGGADALADLRATVAGMLPYADVALVGVWRGAIDASAADAQEIVLSDGFRMEFSARASGAGVALADAMLHGAGRPLVAREMTLTPDGEYLFGVQAEGEDADVGSLVLAVRLLPAPPDDASTEPSNQPR